MSDPTVSVLKLLEQSGSQLHALLLRLTLRNDAAEDLMQELFIRLVESRGFSAAGNQLGYARRAAMNLAFNWRRTRKRRHEDATIQADPVAIEPSPLQRLIQREQLEQVLDATRRLSDASREAFVLRYFQQEQYSSIARTMQRTPDQVRALVHKAVRRITQLLVPDNRPSAPEELSSGQE